MAGAGDKAPPDTSFDPLSYYILYPSPQDPYIDNFLPCSRLKQFPIVDGKWKYSELPAKNPLIQLSNVGIRYGLGIPFGLEYLFTLKSVYDQVVLVPAAKGGSGFNSSEWGVGNPFSNQFIAGMNAAIAAYPNAKLGGILWLLGESAIQTGMASSTYQNFQDAQFVEFRSRITGAINAPIVIGQMSRNWYEEQSNYLGYAIDRVHKDTPNRLPNCWYVSSPTEKHNHMVASLATRTTSIGTNPGIALDFIHFNSEGHKAIGQAMAYAVDKAKNNSAIVNAGLPTLQVSTIFDNGFILGWTIPTNTYAYTYEISYRLQGSQNWIISGYAYDKLSYRIFNLAVNSPYEFRIRSALFGNFSAYSNTVVSTTSAKILTLTPFSDYDFSDESSYAKDVNGVSQVNDRSNNNRHLIQSNNAYKPAFESQDGLNWLRTNSNLGMFCATGFPANSDYTKLIVFRAYDFLGNGILVCGSTGTGHMLWRPLDTPFVLKVGNNASINNWGIFSSWVYHAHSWICLAVTHSATSKVLSVYNNGTLIAAVTENQNNTDTALSINSFGVNGGASMGMNGRYLRSTNWNTVLTAAQILAETNRLAQSYDITFANMPTLN